MIQLRCTTKVQKQLRLKPKDLSEISQPQTTLGNWYVNITTIDRRKFFVFMNEKTLLSFIIFGITKANAKKIHSVFVNGLAHYLQIEGFDDQTIGRIINEYQQMEYTKTHSKQLLGNMNNLIQTYAHYIYCAGGLEYCDLTDIIQRINHMPQRNINWKYSIDLTKELLKHRQNFVPKFA